MTQTSRTCEDWLTVLGQGESLAFARPKAGDEESSEARAGRTIPAECLEQLAQQTGGTVGEPLQIIGAVIDGLLDLRYVTFCDDVVFRDCEFTQGVFLACATFKRDVCFEASTFRSGLILGAALIDGDLILDGANFDGMLGLRGVHVGRNLHVHGARFAQVASFAEASIGWDASFEERGGTPTSFASGSDFSRVHFAGDARFASAEFSEAGMFHGAIFDGRASFDGAVFREPPSFWRARFCGQASFDGAMFGPGGGMGPERGPVNSDGEQGPASVMFDDAQFEQGTSFRRTRFACRAAFRGTRFEGTTWFAQTGSDAPTRFEAGATFHEARFVDRRSFGVFRSTVTLISVGYMRRGT